MKFKTAFLGMTLSVSALFTLTGTAFAAQGDPVAGYQLIATIAVPGGLTKDDIVWADASTGRVYYADAGQATANPVVPPRIVVIDTINNKFVTAIPLPAAPNGVLSISRAREIWAGLADSTVAVINTDTNTITNIINVGGTGRADELGYDPIDRLIMIANDKDTPAFVTFINQQTKAIVKRLNFDGVQAPNATAGLEQPVWDAAAGKFYFTVPATTPNPKGEVEEIDPVQLKVVRSFPTTCGPAGLALLPAQRLITSCGDVIDIASGKIVTTVAGVGADEIWYNSGDNRVYFGGGTDKTTVPVVDGSTYALLTSLQAGALAGTGTPAQAAQRVAADSESNEIVVPVSNLGGVGAVQIWRNGAFLNAFPSPVPTTGPGAYTTTLTWYAPNATEVEIHVGSPNGVLFAQNSNRGSATTGPWAVPGTKFFLQDVTGNKALTADNTLATYVVGP